MLIEILLPNSSKLREEWHYRKMKNKCKRIWRWVLIWEFNQNNLHKFRKTQNQINQVKRLHLIKMFAIANMRTVSYLNSSIGISYVFAFASLHLSYWWSLTNTPSRVGPVVDGALMTISKNSQAKSRKDKREKKPIWN